jgi:hypothetical protein
MGRVYMDVDRDIQALGRSLRTAHWSLPVVTNLVNGRSPHDGLVAKRNISFGLFQGFFTVLFRRSLRGISWRTVAVHSVAPVITEYHSPQRWR